MIDASAPPAAVSRSKLRRLRATATKSKLFRRAQDGESLLAVSSHLAMLTSSIDNLAYFLEAAFQNLSYASTSDHQNRCDLSSTGWNTEAAAFEPAGPDKDNDESLVSPVVAEEIVPAQIGSTLVLDTGTSADDGWLDTQLLGPDVSRIEFYDQCETMLTYESKDDCTSPFTFRLLKALLPA